MQTNFTQLSETMMKNSEADQTEWAAELAQRADEFKAMLEKQEKDRAANIDQQALWWQMHEANCKQQQKQQE